MSSGSCCCTVHLSCQLRQKTSWETAIAKGQQHTHTQAEAGRGLFCVFLLFCFLVLISAENKRKLEGGKEEGGRVKLSGFYSANVYHSRSHVKLLFAQETSGYLHTKTLYHHNTVGLYVGIHLWHEFQPLTNPASRSSGHFSFPCNFRTLLFGFCPSQFSCVMWLQQHYLLCLCRPIPR